MRRRALRRALDTCPDGLTEAYDSSVKLALHTFGLEAMPGDFAHLRVKKGPKCQGADSIKLDANACRATFAENIYDHEVYEHAHRFFCSRLQSAGLRGDEAVEAELASSNLCGALDFPTSTTSAAASRRGTCC